MSFIFYLRGPYKICDRPQALCNQNEPHSSLPLRIYLSSTLIVACVYVATIKYLSLNRRSGSLSQRWMDEKRMGNSHHYVIFSTLAASSRTTAAADTAFLSWQALEVEAAPPHQCTTPSCHAQTNRRPSRRLSFAILCLLPPYPQTVLITLTSSYLYILARLLCGRSSSTANLSASSFRGP